MRFRPLALPALAIALVVGLAACTTSPSPPTSTTTTTPAGSSTVDQSAAIEGAGFQRIECGETYAQSFTAGRSGPMDKVSLAITPFYGAPSLLVRINEMDGVEPGGGTIAWGTYSGPFNLLIDAYTDIPLAAPATLVAGREYAIVFSAVTCIDSVDTFFAALQGEDTYQAGQAFVREGFFWNRDLPGDFAFRTIVAGDGSPTTTTTTLPEGDEWSSFVGCYGSPDRPDLLYIGPRFSPDAPNGILIQSFDGSCTGESSIGVNLFPAESPADAAATCDGLGELPLVAASVADWKFPAADTYLCVPA